ncbi:MAG: hypothetical protein OEW00_13455 [candidate division Zixibacteria bacterium]|nr:hypothetical protein [candidate division Zixibacteria bacterium]
MKSAIVVIALFTSSLCSAEGPEQADDSCLITVYERGDVSIKLYDRSACEYSIFDGNGFVLLRCLRGNEITELIWGEASIDAEDTDYRIVDLNHDGVNEVLTLYSFCTTFWGYMHRFPLDSLGNVTIETVTIPDSISSLIDFNGRVEVIDDEIVIYGGPVDSRRRVVIKYNPDSDSIEINAH